MKEIIYGAILLVILGSVFLFFQAVQPTYQGKQFSSYSELASFLETRTESSYYGGIMGMRGEFVETAVAGVAEALGGAQAAEYSQTNIQVIGVDEPDIVKNDGKYIYTISQNDVVIVDAYPPENAEIKSKIEIDGYPRDLFINGDKLTVFTTGYGKSSIYVYDVSDRENPDSVRNITVQGNYYDSRMIGDYVYAIATQYVRFSDIGPILPRFTVNAEERTVEATSITYFDTYDTSFVYTFVIALNTQNDQEDPNEKVFLVGSTQNLYVSSDNIYTAWTKRISQYNYTTMIIDRAILPNVPFDVSLSIINIRNNETLSEYEKMREIEKVLYDYIEGLGPEEGAEFLRTLEEKMDEVMVEIEKETEKTIIHKIGISGSNIEYKFGGEVPGRVLNQFSMDEHNGNIRIATTTGNTWRNTSLNHVYVLDPSLTIIGRLENLARGEQIFSARFIGDRAYLVTFVRTDPLFVIDLSIPSSPTLLGELKMPGFSTYLHPYDDNHLIGLGQEADERGVTTGQVKISLFDVTDVSNPKETSTYLIGEEDDWAYSEALYDHKAFLFSKTKNLLVIPISINSWYRNNYFQGAYVFDIGTYEGFQLKGTVTHITTNASENRYYYDYSSRVRRSLYMDYTLYTVSNKKIKANSLIDLTEIKEVDLGYTGNGPIPLVGT